MAFIKMILKYKIIAAYSLFTLFLISNNAKAQELNWSNPLPITDSVSDNKNPKLIYDYIFWEKSSDTNSTAIYMDYINANNPKEVLNSANTKYQNIQFIKFYEYQNIPDTLFYLFYETNENGNIDIYYKKYSKDGVFSSPIAFSTNNYDEKNINIYNRNIVWEENNNILYSSLTYNNTFTEPIIIDQGNCHNPVASENIIAYEKIVNDSSQIYCSRYISGSWSSPELIYSKGNNTSLSFVKSTEHQLNNNILLWESFSNNIYKIYYYDFDNNMAIYLNVESNRKLNPNGIFIVYYVKDSNFRGYINCLTYNKEKNDSIDIFVIHPFPSEAQNISNSSYTDIKPRLFVGESECWLTHLYNIWESYRNNHWQLFMVDTEILIGGINENNSNKITAKINAYPNPFINDLNIDFKINHNSKVKLSVYDFNGKLIDVICDEYKNKGNYNYKWNLNNNKTSGVYYLILEVNDFKTIKKIININ